MSALFSDVQGFFIGQKVLWQGQTGCRLPEGQVKTAMQTILVTGATGFVGQHLCRALAQLPVTVRTFERASGGDLSDLAALQRACQGVDTVFHLAGYAHADVNDHQRHWQTNYQGTLNLLEAVQRAEVPRLLFLSSVKAGQPDQPQAAADNAYGASKQAAEQAILTASAPPAQAVIIRPALIYGAGVKGNLARLTAAMRAGWLPLLPPHPSRHSLVYSGDLVRLMLAAIQQPDCNRRILLAAPHQLSMHELYQQLRQAQGKQPAGWAIPHRLLKTAAWGGDVLQGWTGRRMPVGSDLMERLFGQQPYQSDEVVVDGFAMTGVVPEPLTQSLPSLWQPHF